MDQVSVDYKLVVLSSLVRKDDLVFNLGTIIFVICERSVDEDE
jgi:hypothetical protein